VAQLLEFVAGDSRCAESAAGHVVYLVSCRLRGPVRRRSRRRWV